MTDSAPIPSDPEQVEQSSTGKRPWLKWLQRGIGPVVLLILLAHHAEGHSFYEILSVYAHAIFIGSVTPADERDRRAPILRSVPIGVVENDESEFRNLA
jgi:hypothetical protein